MFLPFGTRGKFTASAKRIQHSSKKGFTLTPFRLERDFPFGQRPTRREATSCRSDMTTADLAVLAGICLLSLTVALEAAEIHDVAERSDPKRTQALPAADPAQANLPDARSEIPFHWVVHFGQQEAVKTLLAHGAKLDIYAVALLGPPDDIKFRMSRHCCETEPT